ncbi:acyltransferase [Pedobacter ginsengiterrae]|uniref:Acyltransferase n=1 Tax=Pedobacter ginsengiterrae TaxID=871696 RepID=A0ABP7QHW9_9SPHI
MIFYLRVKNSLFIRFFRFFYKTKFKKFGVNSSILFPLNINGLKNISIGNSVCIDNKVWLAAVAHTGSEQCELIIGDGTCIGNFNHIYATRSIILGRNVLTADKVYISDNLHGYEDITMPILKQPIKQIGAVEIGDGTWLGENVCVIGAKIGKNCVIGANSVVTKDIPDYCVAVGAPAKIIKEYCFDRKEWIKKN